MRVIWFTVNVIYRVSSFSSLTVGPRFSFFLFGGHFDFCRPAVVDVVAVVVDGFV